MAKEEPIYLLIADDEQSLRKGLVSLLCGEHGITLLPEARNGLEAVELAKRHQVHILLTDIRMPGLSGIEVGEVVRKLHPDAELLFLSGYGEFDYAKKAILLNACNYILKPSTPSEILTAVDSARDRILAARHREEESFKLRQEVRNLSTLVVASQKRGQPQQDAPGEEDIATIIGYISAHYHEPLNLAALAEHFHFNSVYLSRYIKSKSGHTFTELLTSTRMYHAARLLKETKLRNREICERVGIGDERYFGQVFQKTFGVSPRDYRKSNRTAELDLQKMLMGDYGETKD